jgi:hypothetical protein
MSSQERQDHNVQVAQSACFWLADDKNINLHVPEAEVQGFIERVKASTGMAVVPASGGVGHMLADVNCPHCGAPNTEHRVENYDPIWRDGDVVCTRCGGYVRGYDAG